MRIICDTQMRLEFYRSNSKMSKKLEKISEILQQKEMSFLEKIAEDFKTAKGLGIEKGKRVRVDSTGVESNIHHLTDGELLWDCVRVIDRIIEGIMGEYPDMEIEYHNHTKRAKKRRYRIVNTSSKEKRVEAYKDLLKVSGLTVEYSESCIGQLREKVRGGDIEAGVYKKELEGYLESLRVIINQTERRVLHDGKVESKDKLVSIFETHTDILAKGKRKTIFGHKVLLSGRESNLILDCVVERGNWSDAEYFEKGIDRLKERYDIHPEEITADGGFASKGNYDYAVGKGIKKVLFTKKCSSKIVELAKTSRAYKRLKKFRAGIEGCISAAKRAYGLSRCTWKGWQSFQSYVWLSVIAFNLNIMTEALLK